MGTTETESSLLSTGELARRIGLSQSGIRKAERAGRIPAGIVIVGSRRKVWPSSDVPKIQEALGEGRRQGAAA